MITLPFNHSTYTGYSSSLLSQMMPGYSHILTMSAVFSYFIACCFYIEAEFKIFKYRINDIDERIKNGDKLAEVFLRETIAFHNEVLKYVELLIN